MAKRILLIVSILIIMPALIHAAVTDFLILQDIAPYKLFTGIPGEVFSGPPSKYSQSTTGGILEAASHFSENDVTYSASYTEPAGKWPFVEVAVTKHSGSDSDKWLLHEVDKEFRNYYGVPDPSYMVKTIDNNLVMAFGAAGWNYRWISGNKIVMIEYHDSKMAKPEPLEIVSAYLVKHPSTLSSISTVSIRTVDNKTIWIKDEMDRRLWLCDKWFMQLQLQKVDEKKVLQESFESMKVFLKYRERYYGMKSDDEENLIYSYLLKNNGTAIKAKLDEYKKWWSVNKDKAISIP